jgi:hypothetical protein
MSLEECTAKKGVWYENVRVFTGVSKAACSSFCSVRTTSDGNTLVSGLVATPEYVYEGTDRLCNPDAVSEDAPCVDRTAQSFVDMTGATGATRTGPSSLVLSGVGEDFARQIAPFKGYWYTRKNRVESGCVLSKKKCPHYISKEVQARAFRTTVLTIVSGCMIPLLLAYLLYTLFKR